MLCSSSRSPSRFARYSAFLVLLPAFAAAADPVVFSTASIELARQRIIIASTSKPADFLAAAPAISMRQNWQILLNNKPVNLSSDVLINARVLTVTLEYEPRDIPFTDTTAIPKNQLSVTYLPTSQRLTLATGKAESTAAPPTIECWKFAFTDDKKKADIDVSGGWQAGVGAKPQYYWTAKAACPFDLGEGAKYGRLGPSFTGQAATEDNPQSNANPNSMKAGLTWDYIQALQSSRNGFLYSADLVSYEFENKAKKEAVLGATGTPILQNYLAKDSNLIWDAMARYSWNNKNPLGVSWTLGFAGFEAGRSLTRTVRNASQTSVNQPIARVMFNFDIYKDFYYKDKTVFTLHGQQVLRLPLEPEPFLEAGVNGGNQFLTTRPRHWSLVEANWMVTKGAGLALTYKRGTLPPAFDFVDHQIMLGFSVQLKH